jgi:hypothetical protein
LAWTGDGDGRTLLAQDGAAVAADDYEAEALLGGIVDDGDFGVGDVDFFALDLAGLSRVRRWPISSEGDY